MASEVKADKLSPSAGTTVTLGDASDTITIPTGATLNIVDGLGVAGGGTGLTGFTAGDVLYATGTTTLAKLAKGTAEQVLAMNSGATAPDWGSVDLTVLPTITVGKGGTNLTSFTAGDVLYATGSTTLAKLAKPGTPADEVLTFATGASAPSWVASGAGGKIGQVIQTVDTTLRETTSTSLVTTGISVTITPSATSSKILLTMDGVIGYFTGLDGALTPYRNINSAGDVVMTVPGSLDCFRSFGESDGATGAADAIGFCYLDDPATTSVTVYTMYWHTQGSKAYIGQQYSVPRTCPTLFTAMEILA